MKKKRKKSKTSRSTTSERTYQSYGFGGGSTPRISERVRTVTQYVPTSSVYVNNNADNSSTSKNYNSNDAINEIRGLLKMSFGIDSPMRTSDELLPSQSTDGSSDAGDPSEPMTSPSPTPPTPLPPVSLPQDTHKENKEQDIQKPGVTQQHGVGRDLARALVNENSYQEWLDDLKQYAQQNALDTVKKWFFAMDSAGANAKLADIFREFVGQYTDTPATIVNKMRNNPNSIAKEEEVLDVVQGLLDAYEGDRR